MPKVKNGQTGTKVKQEKAVEKPTSTRLLSIDAYRGLVMILIWFELLELNGVSRAKPDSAIWAFLAHHNDHIRWVGCSLHDLIQPSFVFLVGLALTFSMASRAKKGQGKLQMFGHTVIRAIILIALGIAVYSVGQPMTNFTFKNVLAQIGLGYVFLYLIALRPVRDQWIAFGAIVFGWWLLFALWPLPKPGFDLASVGVRPNSSSILTGFAAHWNMNTNPSQAFDVWFLNLFPRESRFLFDREGYNTLSFVPSMASMLLGVIAGHVIRGSRSEWGKVKWFAIAGVIGIASGWIIGSLGICPVVKKVWSSSWVLFSGGYCFLFLAFFYAVIDVLGYKKWSFPLVVVGMNSLFAYVVLHYLTPPGIKGALETHFGGLLNMTGPIYYAFALGMGVCIVNWLLVYFMYRNKIFVKI